jgi:hypothetical protein
MTKRRLTKGRSVKTAVRRKQVAGPTTRRWHEAVIQDYARLLALPNVERVALGWKERRGRVTARMAVKLYVAEKKATVAIDEQFPKTTAVLVPVGRGVFHRLIVPTDVVWHGPASLVAMPADFLNPAPSGAMIGVPGRQFGTFGGVVTNAIGQTFAVTAGHVVQALQGKVIVGIQLLQPSVLGPGVPPGASTLFGRTVAGFFGNTPNGFIDVALLQLSVQRSATTDALDGLKVRRQILSSAVVINNHIPCTKFGAATGRTFGLFVTRVPSMVINGIAVTDVLEFIGLPGHLFAAAGDSGALVLSNVPGAEPLIIGVLFAATSPTPDAPAGRGFVIPFERLQGVRPF